MGEGTLRVAVLMGSQSDWPVMQAATEALKELGIAYEARVLSAHRTPERLVAYVREAEERGACAFICGAGKAAHLAGVVAAHTLRPVLGVPLSGSDLGGLDALLSTVQMPGGIPVATFAIGKAGARNAALFAGALLGVSDPALRERIAEVRRRAAEKIPDEPLASS